MESEIHLVVAQFTKAAEPRSRCDDFGGTRSPPLLPFFPQGASPRFPGLPASMQGQGPPGAPLSKGSIPAGPTLLLVLPHGRELAVEAAFRAV